MSSAAYTAEEIPIVKEEVRRNVKALREEIVQFIEHQVVLFPDQPAQIPSFFVKGYNFLKRECAKIDHFDVVLDWLPRAVEMCLLTESGPQSLANFPRMDENGFLVDPITDESMRMEVARLIKDIVTYTNNHVAVTGQLPFLPHGFMMSHEHFIHKVQKEEFATNENRQLATNLPVFLQKVLNVKVPHIPEMYVVRCAHELQYL